MGIKIRSAPPRNTTPRREDYFPECRKDAQCHCPMCKASIHATLDLCPSNHLFGSSITNRSDSPSPSPFKMSGKENQWPEREVIEPRIVSQQLKEQSRIVDRKEQQNVKRNAGNLQQPAEKKVAVCKRWGLVVVLLVILFTAEFAWPWTVHRLWDLSLSAESARQLAEASMARKRLVDRLDFVKRKVSRALNHTVSVSNCTGTGARWRLEDGNFVHSSCQMYASPLERLSIWGYASKTGGVLGREFVERSFTVLSGRAIEWQEGQIESIIHQEGSSWVMPKWAASAMLLDGDTWILEYKRTALSQGFGGLPGLLHLARCGLRKISWNAKTFIDTAFFAPVHSFRFKDHSRLPPT